jgi:hypothetical protein
MKIEILSPFQISLELLDVDQIPSLVFRVSYSFECTFGNGRGQDLRCCFNEREWHSFVSNFNQQLPNWKLKNMELKDMSGNFSIAIKQDDERHFLCLSHNIDLYCEDTRTLENRYSCNMCMPLDIDDLAHIANTFLEFPIK